MYPLEKISLPPNYSPQHPFWKEIGNEPGVRDEALAPYPRSEYAVKKHIQEYYAVITHLDEQVGKIISHLENQDMLKNTYIIFTSDHGLAVGQHGLIGKQSLYDHSIRVPMIISGPKIKKGSRFDQDIYLQDIVPTTLELANISISNEIDFKSFYNLIINGDDKKIHDGIEEIIYSGFSFRFKAILDDAANEYCAENTAILHEIVVKTVVLCFDDCI